MLTSGASEPTVSSSVAATAEAAILVTSGVVVWALTAWVVAIGFAAAIGRLPGSTGRRGRVALGRIAPAVAARILLTAVGVSLLAGTSACAVPASSAVGSGSTIPLAAPISTAASGPALPAGGTAAEVSDPTETRTEVAPTPADPPSVALESSSVAPDPAPTAVASLSIDWPDAVQQTPPGTSTPPATPATPFDAPSPGSQGGIPTPDEASDDAAPAEPPADEDSAPDSLNPAAAPAPVGNAPSTTQVVVESGDTLWSIAHHHLTSTATDAEIDSAWRSWYLANAAVIGGNPDLIQPGQHLLPPDPETGPES